MFGIFDDPCRGSADVLVDVVKKCAGVFGRGFAGSEAKTGDAIDISNENEEGGSVEYRTQIG